MLTVGFLLAQWETSLTTKHDITTAVTCSDERKAQAMQAVQTIMEAAWIHDNNVQEQLRELGAMDMRILRAMDEGRGDDALILIDKAHSLRNQLYIALGMPPMTAC